MPPYEPLSGTPDDVKTELLIHAMWTGYIPGKSIPNIESTESTGAIVDLQTGAAFVPVHNWYEFTRHWMDQQWQLHRDRNYNVLVAAMREVDMRDRGQSLPIQEYVNLALECQAEYFAEQ